MITTERLTIRPLDAEMIAEMKDNYPMHQRFLNHIQKLELDPTLKGWDAWIVQLKDGTYIGDIGFKGKPDANQMIEVGYGFAEAFRRRGYAFESVQALITEVEKQHAGIKIKATSLKENEASNRLLEKLGFTVVDRDNSFYYWLLESY